MLTLQDLQDVSANQKDRAEFVKTVIASYTTSEQYTTAKIAEDYERCRNTTAMNYQKFITDIYGRKYIDRNATVHRATSNFFHIFCTQLTQYMLGNGVQWASGEQPLGDTFDASLQKAGKYALVGGVSYGFYNLDHVEVFRATEFAPLFDEETGALAAGVRWWRIAPGKPLRATLYEIDGYTDFLFSSEKNRVSEKWGRIESDTYFTPKKPYKMVISESVADGAEIIAGENYPSFPIVPFWANDQKQSELVGMREKIDAYDFILNGWLDDLDGAQLYWVIRGAAGMDDPDLLRFLDRLRTVKAAAPDEGQDVQPVTVQIPVEAREQLLERLERRLYKDAMIVDTQTISAGATTATEIRAAYEPQNVKGDSFEYQALEFVQGLLKVAGVQDTATFTRSAITNTQEEIQTLISAAEYLSKEYMTRKILSLLGDGDKAQTVLEQMDSEDADRIGALGDEA